MKKQFILIILILLLVGCSKSNENIIESHDETILETESNDTEENEETDLNENLDEETNMVEETLEESKLEIEDETVIDSEIQDEIESEESVNEETVESADEIESSYENNETDNNNSSGDELIVTNDNTYIGTVRKMKAAEIIDHVGHSNYEKSYYNETPDYYMLQLDTPINIPIENGSINTDLTYLEISFPGDSSNIQWNDIVGKKIKVKVQGLSLVQDDTLPAETFYLYNPTFEIIE